MKFRPKEREIVIGVAAAATAFFGVRQGIVQKVPALGPLSPSAVLEDPGRFLDRRAPLRRARLEHLVELALTDEEVLGATDAHIPEQLLDVEEPAGGAVQVVAALATPLQGPPDTDLGSEVRKGAVTVVDDERDFGPSERRAPGRPREDDVVHALRAQGAGGLRTEDPGERVHDVRLPTAVRADDDRDPRLEGEGDRIGEGLEPLQGERLDVHGPPTVPSAATRIVDPPTEGRCPPVRTIGQARRQGVR